MERRVGVKDWIRRPAGRTMPRRVGILVWATALLAVALQALLRSLEGNLTRFTGTQAGHYGYAALHDPRRTSDAFDFWHTAEKSLQHVCLVVATPETIIRTHGIADVALVVVYVALAALAIRLLDLSWWLLPAVGLAAVADLVRNAVEWWSTSSHTFPHRAAPVLAALPVVKVGLLAGVAVIVAVAKRRELWAALRYTARSPASERILLAGATAFALLLFLGQIGAQYEEIMRAWVGDPVEAVEALLAVVLLLVAVRVLGERVPQAVDPDVRIMLATGVVATVVGIGVLVVFHGSGLLVAGVIIAVVGITTRILGPSPRPPDDHPDGRLLRPVIVALPALVVYLLTVRLVGVAFVTGDRRWEALALTLVWLATTFAVGVLASTPRPRSRALLGIGIAVIGGLAALAATNDSGPPARRVGTVTLLLIALSALGAASAVLRQADREVGCPESLYRLGFRRTPLILFVIVWALTASMIDGRNGMLHYNDARTVARFTAAPALAGGPPTATAPCVSPPPSLVNLPGGAEGDLALRFCQWLQRTAAGKAGQEVPLVLVTASGGGVRAAAWTARVLDCLFLPGPAATTGPATTTHDPCAGTRPVSLGERWPYVFAAGGASGGSVGLVSTVAEVLAMGPSGGEPDDWVSRRMGGDILAAPAAYTLLKELPLGLAGLYVGDDRTAHLERAWERGWRGATVKSCAPLAGRAVASVGFLSATEQCPATVPLLLLNGTNTTDGGRVNISPLAAAPGPDKAGPYLLPSHDLVDSLCPTQDVPLFTAAFLSSRFPILSSAGGLPAGDAQCTSGRPSLHVVDGGYRDNSGTSQVGELLQALAPMIAAHNAAPGPFARVRPTHIHVDNDEGPPLTVLGETPAVGDLLRPLEAALHIGLDRGPEERARLRAEMDRVPSGPSGPVQATFRLFGHPGRRLPLGWTLSDAAFDDIGLVFLLNDQPTALLELVLPSASAPGPAPTSACPGAAP